jgi:hypothetical protein
MMDTTRVKYYGKWVAGIGVLALIGAAGVSGYRFLTKPPVDTTVAVEAPVAPTIAKVKKRIIKPKQVVVYAPEAKAKLKLPPAVLANTEAQVIGATTVAPSERRVTVTSVLDATTGETTTYTKPEPYPLLAVESRGEARFSYGYKLTRDSPVPTPVGRLSLTQDFVQIKALHIGVTAALDTDRSAFIGLGLAYRW